MNKVFLVKGVCHAYRPDSNLSLGHDTRMRDWVVQWTTPNNTRMTCADTYEKAVTLWRDQKFTVPAGLNVNNVKDTLAFNIDVTEFQDGIEVFPLRFETVFLEKQITT